MVVSMIAHMMNGRRMYHSGFNSFVSEDELMEALRKSERDPIITDTGVSCQVDDDFELPPSLAVCASMGLLRSYKD